MNLLVIALAVVAVLLVLTMWSFLEARQEIARYNARVIESCYLMECDITPMGTVSCKFPTHASELVGPGAIELGVSNV